MANSGTRTLAKSASRRVLVVDDNVDAANSIAQLLELLGHRVRCVYDGPSALSATDDFRPEIVVLDIGLPGMDGYEVARRLRDRRDFKSTPIVAVTGYSQEEDRARSREAGFSEHLAKPVDPEMLHNLVLAAPS
jgi:two-component system OmpR family response regulator